MKCVCDKCQKLLTEDIFKRKLAEMHIRQIQFGQKKMKTIRDGRYIWLAKYFIQKAYHFVNTVQSNPLLQIERLNSIHAFAFLNFKEL